MDREKIKWEKAKRISGKGGERGPHWEGAHKYRPKGSQAQAWQVSGEGEWPGQNAVKLAGAQEAPVIATTSAVTVSGWEVRGTE